MYLLDVTVVHTSTKVPHQSRMGAWAAHAARHKVEENKLLTKFSEDATFIPLAFESWGIFHEQVCMFLGLLMQSFDRTRWELDVGRADEMRVAIAVAIQEGNYAMALHIRPIPIRQGKGAPTSG